MNFTTDDYYMNHVYLSEFWLWQHMEKNFVNHPSLRWQKQRVDEKKHTAMTRGALFKTLNRNMEKINHDPRFSIEKIIFEEIGGIDVDSITEEEFPAFVYVVERRAVFLFKYYLKHGSNDYYKKVIKRLIHDEDDHLDIHKDTVINTEAYRKYQQLDKKLWKEISKIYSTDNLPFFNNIEYWKDLFSHKLKDKINVIS
jgi:rubrerythrin